MDEAARAEAVTPTTTQQMRRDLDELSSQLGQVCCVVDAETMMQLSELLVDITKDNVHAVGEEI